MTSGVERGMAEARGVLFLCSGNMVRSAFADLYAGHHGCPLPVGSAATLFRNDRMLDETAQALIARGVPEAQVRAFRPTHISEVVSTLEEGTLVFAMARMHLEPLMGLPKVLRSTFLLTEVLGQKEEIADPVMDGADFELTFQRIADCVEALIERLKR